MCCCSLYVIRDLSCYYLHATCRFSCFFFFKQKTAYEMRISDWSSDVCSSDLPLRIIAEPGARFFHEPGLHAQVQDFADLGDAFAIHDEIGRASCRERVCQYV